MVPSMNKLALALVLSAVVAGCKSEASPPAGPGLADLSGSLDAVRSEFNAHKQEARFLTLLSPT